MPNRPTPQQRQTARDHAAFLADLDQRLRHLERTAHLANSSIEDGAILGFDADGQQTLQVGKQYDGTSAALSMAGPLPPRLTRPILTPFLGGLSVEWDGLWADTDGNPNPGVVAPMDLKQVDAVVATTATADFVGTPPAGSIVSPRGGGVLVTLPTADTVYVALVARSMSGKAGPVSPVATGAPLTTPSDGIPPATSPTPTTAGGLGSIYVSWGPVLNRDAVTYDVHVSTVTGFTPDASTRLLSTGTTYLAVKHLPDGTPFAYDTAYYFVVVARDPDGAAPPGAETPGEMNRAASADILAGSITGELLQAVMSLATVVSTRAKVDNVLTGPGVDLTTEGLFVYDSTGTERVALPNNRSYIFRGTAEFETLVAQVTTLVDASVQQGHDFRLESSVRPPSNQPTVAFSHTTAQYTWYNTTFDHYGWSPGRAGSNRVYTAYTDASTNAFTEEYDTTTRRRTKLIAGRKGLIVTGSVFVPGSTAANDAVYYIGHGTGLGVWYVQWEYIDGHGGSSWTVPDGALATGSSLRGCALGYDAAADQLLIAQSRPGAADHVQIFRTPRTGTTLTLAVETVDDYPFSLSSVLYGTFDFGANRYVTMNRGTTTMRVFTTTGANDDPATFPSDSNGMRGFYWSGTNFVGIDADGAQMTYEAGNRDIPEPTWYAASTFRDAPSGAETLLGPVASFVMHRRARLTVTTQALPAGATEARVYLARITAPNPAAASMVLQGSTTGTTAPKLTVTNAVFTASPTNPANPLSSGFGATTPARVVSTESATPRARMSGDGTGRAGDFEWDAAGNPISRMTWVTPSLNAPYTTSASGPVPQYARDPVGNVHMKGLTNTNGATDGAVLFTFPTGFRPKVETRSSNDTAPTATTSGRVRVEATGDVRLYAKTGTPTAYWLDMVFQTG